MPKGNHNTLTRTTIRHTPAFEKLLNDVACERLITKTDAIIEAILVYAQIPPNSQEIKERAARIECIMNAKELCAIKKEDNWCRYWSKNAFTSIISIAKTSINAGCGINMMQVKKMVRHELKIYNSFPPDIKDELRDVMESIKSLLVESKIKHYCSNISNDSSQQYKRYK